jgi:hypothetical protein
VSAYYSRGLSMRDWFAGMALQGMLANSDFAASATRMGESTEGFRGNVTRTAYVFADAMLSEREKDRP